MIYCHTCFNWRNAGIALKEFVKENEKDVFKVDRRNFIVRKKDGSQHHFISFRELPKWSLGKTYMWQGDMWHSNELIREVEK